MAIKPKINIKDITLSREELEQLAYKFTGLFEVYDLDTGKLVLRTTDFWEAEKATWSEEGSLWPKRKLNREVRKVENKVTRILYGPK